MKTPLATSLPSADWTAEPVSPLSRFGDDEWQLDIRTAGRRADHNWIDWRLVPPRGARISAAAGASLTHAAKQFLWSMVVNPPTGRKRLSPTSVQIKAVTLKTLIGWMALEGLTAFHDIDAAAVERLRAWLLARRGQSGRPLSPNTVANYMVVLKDLYRQRAKLDDPIIMDPLPQETTYEAAGLTPATKGTIPFIPDAIAIALLSSALEWVEDHGPTII